MWQNVKGRMCVQFTWVNSTEYHEFRYNCECIWMVFLLNIGQPDERLFNKTSTTCARHWMYQVPVVGREGVRRTDPKWIKVFLLEFIPPLHGFHIRVWFGQRRKNVTTTGSTGNITTRGSSTTGILSISLTFHIETFTLYFANFETLQEHNITLRFTAQPIERVREY